MDAVQRAVLGPAAEVVVHRAARWKIPGQRAPLAAGAEDVHQAIDDVAVVAATIVVSPHVEGSRESIRDGLNHKQLQWVKAVS